MTITTLGIDLAKNVFAVHGINDNGKRVLVKPKVSRADLLPLIAQLPPYLCECFVGRVSTRHVGLKPDLQGFT